MSKRKGPKPDRVAEAAVMGTIDHAGRAHLDAVSQFDADKLIEFVKSTGGGHPNQWAGNAAEAIANQDALYRSKLSGHPVRSIPQPRHLKDGADLAFRNLDTGVRDRVQLKFVALDESGVAEIKAAYVRELTSEHNYAHMDRIVVPKEHVDVVRSGLREQGHADLADKVTDRATADGKPQSISEVKTAGRMAKEGDRAGVERLLANRRSFVAEAHMTGMSAAKVGAGIGMGVSFVRNAILVGKGEKSAADAAVSVAVDTAKAGAKSYAIGAQSVGIRYIAERVGAKALARSAAAPVAIANAALEISLLTAQLLAGKIEPEEYFVSCGQVGVSGVSGFYVGAAAGAVLGPPGALVGSMAGFLVSSLVYDSLLGSFREARLMRERRELVEQLCWAARRAMKQQREELRQLIDTHYAGREKSLRRAFGAFDSALVAGDTASAVASLQAIGQHFSDSLKLMSLTEFKAGLFSNDKGPMRIGVL
jgi:hypothetical protein